MPYYTDSDRKRAAAARQRNSLIRQLKQTPEDAYDIFGYKVPRVKHAPTLEEYGLSEDVEQRLKKLDKEHVEQERSRRKSTAWIFTFVVMGLVMFILLLGSGDKALDPNSNAYRPQLDMVFSVIMSVITIGGLSGMLYFFTRISEVKPIETPEHTRFKEYEQQLSYYEYWQRKASKDHWNNMSGHAFEEAVANLFRGIGFTADVSPRGGDGGVDIILLKGTRKIAVQCKRYKNSVGPHVIRDLWGTMMSLGYEEGCIVTTTGFTKGVRSFAEDKEIILVDLNDILKTTAIDGEKHLESIMGEN